MDVRIVLSSALLVIAVSALLPLLFERSVKHSRFLSLTYKFKIAQHLFPSEQDRVQRIMPVLLAHKDRWSPVSPEVIGRRIRTIRELTGLSHRNHVLAIEVAGAVISDLASNGFVKPTGENAIRPLSANDILQWLIQISPQISVDANQAPANLRDQDLRDHLAKNPIDLEQITEILVAMIVALQARIELKPRESSATS